MNDQLDETIISQPSGELAGGATDKGTVRPVNEDTFLLPDESDQTQLGLIYIVADGVGGQKFGAEASQLAARVIQDTFYQARREFQEIDVALQTAAAQANTAVYEEAQRLDAFRMGCTMVAAVHHQGRRNLMHVGDARAYLLREGEFTQLTQDDTWVRHQVDAGLIGDDTAQIHELRHIVTRVIGNKESVEVTFSEPSAIESGDVLLLCSDGLHGSVSDEEMSQLLAEHPPQAAADALVKAAIEAQVSDNVTAVVIASGSQPEVEPDPAALPTIIRPPQPDTPPELHPQRTGRSPWTIAGISVIAIAVILALGWVLWTSLRATPADILPTVDAAATVPAADNLDWAGENAPIPTATLTPEPIEPTPTAAPIQIEPTATQPIPPTAEIEASTAVTPTLESNSGCVNTFGGFAFVWTDDQIAASTCDLFAGLELDHNDQELILDGVARSVSGPDQTCDSNKFIKVRSETNPEIEGWVLEYMIEFISPGESCPAP